MLVISILRGGSCGRICKNIIYLLKIKRGWFWEINIEDNAMGSCKLTTCMRDFQECVQQLEIMDIAS